MITEFKKIPRPRPFLVRTFNKFSSGMNWLPRLKAEELEKVALKKTGSDQFEDLSYQTPLRKLVQSIEEEAQLHPAGRYFMRTWIVDCLSNRLRIEQLLRLHPEIRQIELPPLIFISGLQRTGTTKLQRLLAADPDTRALLSWEGLSPAPIHPEKWPADSDPRKRIANLKVKVVRYMNPEFFAIHPLEPEAPEEDVLLLDNSFYSTTPDAILNVPTYGTWLEEQDHTKAYEYLKLQLQVLQWQRPGKRMVLKSPHHLEFLPFLFKIFPKAKVINTHRDPINTIASFCSLVYFGRRMFSDRVDPQIIGQQWSRKIFRMLNNSMDYREEVGDINFFDVYYDPFIKNSIGTIEEIYNFLEVPFTESVLAQVEKANRENPKNKYGKHVYRLSDYGLTPEMLEPHLKRYCQKHQIDIPV